ncbi:hypothetical protein [Thalassospira povalilytica]|uniref:hypothetical protein n=1 Tax=Thalassospira povalilytica TaxID=732237 RepID=UPI001D1837BE|nr:hypothetical protein [Thalassospira povalilytica]MCC4241207.1 hypothetical protein [Thalassospira povalilytica]
MQKEPKERSLLAEIIGSEIVIPRSNFRREAQPDILKIVSNDLHDELANFFGSSPPFFQTSLPLDHLLKYKDGRFSSIEKSIKGGFGRHQGFDLIDSLSLAGNLMARVVPQLNRRLISIYSDLINQNNDLLNQLHHSRILPEISKLKSIQEFIHETASEIEEISKSPPLSIATLTNLQQRRIDLKEIFHTSFSRLKCSVDSIYFAESEVANNYIMTTHALSGYVASLVLECVISGNVGDESVANLKKKIEAFLNDLNSITRTLFDILNKKQNAIQNEIISSNTLYRWSFDHLTNSRINALQNDNQSIEQIKHTTLRHFDIEVEMQRIDEFITSRHIFLKRIEIERQEN